MLDTGQRRPRLPCSIMRHHSRLRFRTLGRDPGRTGGPLGRLAPSVGRRRREPLVVDATVLVPPRLPVSCAAMADRVTLAEARALWWQKQGLGDAARTGPLAAR